MHFKKKEALDNCQDCGSRRPNFYKRGAYDPNCVWSIANKSHRCTIAKVDEDNKEDVLPEVFKDLVKCELETGKIEAKLVSAVQIARWSYVHVID
jgi:hypothetical protein